MIRSVRVLARTVAVSAVLAVAAGCAAPAAERPPASASPGAGHGAFQPIGCPSVSVAYSTSAPAPDSTGGTPMNTPQAEELAQALGTQGRGAYADVFGLLVVDLPPGRVVLCVTDVARGRQLAAAAKRADPGIDLSRLDVFGCAYSERQLAAAVDRMPRRAGESVDGFPLYSFAPAGANAGIDVGTSQQGTRSTDLREKLTALGGGIPVFVVQGSPATAAQLSVPARSDG